MPQLFFTPAALKDTIGIGAHFERRDLPPFQRADEVIAKLHNLGIKNVRTDIYNYNQSWLTTRHHQTLHALADGGVKFMAVLGRGKFDYWGRLAPPKQMMEIILKEGYLIRGFEAANEPDHPPVNPYYPESGGGPFYPPNSPMYPEWWTWTKEHIVALNEAKQSFAQLAGKPLVMPALVHKDSAAKIGDVTHLNNSCMNAHPYAGNKSPTVAQNQLFRYQNRYMFPWVENWVPIYATEFGFTTVTPPPVKGWNSINEEQKAILTLRQYLTQALSGFSCSYAYGLVDDGLDPNYHEHHFGWLTYDLQEKQVYKSMKYFMDMLNTPSPTSVNQSKININTNDPQVRWIEVQRADRTKIAYVWQERQLGAAPTRATVTQSGITSARRRDLKTNKLSTLPVKGSSFDIIVSDWPQAVRFW